MKFRYLYGDVLIVVDGFSSKTGVISEAILDETKPLMPQLYRCLSGNEWDEFMEKFDQEMRKSEVRNGDSSSY